MERVKPVETLGMFRRSIIYIYEHMGNVFLMSALWLVCALTVVLLPAATVAVYHVMARVLAKEEVSIADTMAAVKSRLWRAYGLAAFILALVVVLVFDQLFFLTVPESPYIRLFGGILVWPLVFIAFASNYVAPVLVTQDVNWLQVLKRAALMALDNLGFTIAVGLGGFIFIALGILVPPFTVLAFAATLASFQLQAVRALMESYEGTSPQEYIKGRK